MDMPNPHFLAPAPVPRKTPLGPLGFVLTMARNPLEIWGEGAYRLPVVHSEWMGTPTIIVSDPAAIRHVLVENAKNYAMQPLRQRVLRPILRDGLLTAEGELWRRTRKSLAPIFAPRNIQALAPVVAERSRLFAEELATHADDPVDIATETTLLTYDILQATLFTGDIVGQPAQFARAVSQLLRTMGRVDPLDVLDAPAILPRLTRILGRRSLGYFRTLIAATIDRRRAMLRTDPDDAPRDLLTLLLESDGLSRSEIEDNLITFIGAGHETTARALGWTLYLLSQAPAERAEVEAELDAFFGTLTDTDPALWPDRLIHTRAVFEEAMRLYPPAPSLNRMAIEQDSVGDVVIPKGASVLVLPWIVHRHRRLWEDPDAFMPSRFLPANRARLDRYQYIPFGVGPRVCIGQSFAMQEGVIALAHLLRRLRFDYAGATPPWPIQKITVQPDNELPMSVTLRR